MLIPISAPRSITLIVAAASMYTLPASGQEPAQRDRGERSGVSILYTGRSFGALGVRRAQDEHELLTEQANAEGAPFKLVSHLAWRVPGIVIFLPGQEPEGDELAFALAARGEAERVENIPALTSANVLLLQDPWRPDPDLLAMLGRNPRRNLEFPDLVPTTVTVSRFRTPRDQRMVIVETPGAVWPRDAAVWSTGEINRVDVLDSRIFELPLNLGEIGPRATLISRMRAVAESRSALVIGADLGHQQGDVGIAGPDRARLDFMALREMGYSLVVPFEFELGLGADTLAAVAALFPEITLLAANVRNVDSTLFVTRRIIQAGKLRIGVLGLVNATIRDRLPRERLQDYTFEPAADAARREVALLRAEGADAVVALSNLDAADNATLAQNVSGIDAILADLPNRFAPEVTNTRVELPDRPAARPGAPALIARSAGDGVAVGRLDLEFRAHDGSERLFLAAVEHRLEPVTDNIPRDSALVRRIASAASIVTRERGELMFPAFVDLATRHPELSSFDRVTAQGRVSKEMWEAFMARLLRLRARAEVAVIRRLDQFPPLIGKLHENEIAAWLWTEDQIVVLDVLGSELRALLRSDTRGELATSGIDPAAWTVQGHRLDDQTYYRVATVDVLYEGARSFSGGRRVRRSFVVARNGDLVPSGGGRPLALRDFVFGELRRIRGEGKGDAHLDAIAALVSPDPAYANLLAFTFDRPTLWASLNRVNGRDGYGSVQESRVIGNDSWVAGISGRFIVTHERLHNATDLGVAVAYARQGVRAGGSNHIGESADDLRFDVTFRPSVHASSGGRRRPFVRALFDTEFTPTVDPRTSVANEHQLLLRGSAGMLMLPGRYWRRVEVALALENDLGRPNLQYGVQSATDLVVPIGLFGLGRGPRPTYRLRNDFTYLFPAKRDAPHNLALRYNMVHEILIPLVDELSLSIAADMFFFKGKVEATRDPGMSALLRVGVTYDRLWKPRYQPFL
ncbi:hypothetical protein BH23GEM2_BH23GEM2_24930 [soil metagenome]